MSRRSTSAPADVHFSEHRGVRYLHLGSAWVQGAMRISQPTSLVLDYVQRMMGWLLWSDLDELPQTHAMQLGLGAGALTRFTCQQLGMRTTVVELNPQVVETCKQWFKLPFADERLQIVLANAEEEILKKQWQGQVDALQVDLYDHQAAAPVLDSEDFYDHCRSLLTPTGQMTVNLFGRHHSFDASLEKIVKVFGPQAVWTFSPTREGNTIVLAQRCPLKSDLVQQAEAIQTRWQLPATSWLHMLQPQG